METFIWEEFETNRGGNLRAKQRTSLGLTSSNKTFCRFYYVLQMYFRFRVLEYL